MYVSDPGVETLAMSKSDGGRDGIQLGSVDFGFVGHVFGHGTDEVADARKNALESILF